MDNYNSSSSYPYNNHGYGGYPPAPYSPSPYPPSPNHPYPPANSPSPYMSSPYPPPTNQPYPPTYSPAPYPYYQNTIHTGPTSYGYPAPAPAPPLPNPHSVSHPSEYTYSSPSHSDQYPNPSVYTGIQASSSPSAPPFYQQQGSFHLLTPNHHTQPSISSPMSSQSSFNNHSMSSSFHMHHREDSASSLEYGHYRQDSASSVLGEQHHMGADTASHISHNRPSLYPQIDDFSKLHIAEAAASAPLLQSTSSRYEAPPLNSWEAGHSGPVPHPSVYPALTHSNTFPDSSHGQNMQIVPVGQCSSRILLLHGYLDIWVFEAKNLPNMDMFHKTLGDIFNKLPVNISNKIEGKVSHTITSDPYVSITITSAVIGRTFVISNSENPVWKQHFYVPVAHNASDVQFIVKDSDVVGSQLIGVVSIPIEKIVSGNKIEGSFPILNNSGKPCKPGASLSISIQYAPLERLKIHHLGVGPGPYSGVAGTYFPLRKGGKVTLYQDAHVPDGCLPLLKLGNGMQYVHGKCWHDIFIAISQAKRLIYITGWSIWHKVKLVRDGSDVSKYTLGDILRRKSQEGVRVLLLIWDDPTSRSILGYKTDGVMATHDEETRRFFKDSSVKVLLCPRIAGKRHSWVKQQEVGTIYTHHQKTVIVDTDADNYRRRIMAFVGGLDLCDGRYDTPHHPIFSSLQTVHKDDYHNPTYSGSVIGCPREPWHDLHSKIDGPAAYDVLTNFEQRWLKASTPRGLKKLKKSEDDALLKIERMPEILGVLEAPCLAEDHPESWHVQIFRSIDSNSVKGFPKDPKDATNQNLVCGKNVLIDMSIHTAYVKAIRSAQRFIYIENQYFLGSSYNWNSNKELGANNLIPMEIALKIAEKIRENQRFAVYIIVPMWPEGNPNGAATQRILFWQHKTMQMMYEIIYKALLEAGLEDVHDPQDFLNFFCLGNREAADSSYTPPIIDNPNAANNTPQALSQKSRRFMIYVHSKGMIVDDEYVIIGSANINQRSMEGTRDTEIAMGAYQPQHTSAKEPPSPRGQVYGYRMSLMAEHLGLVEDCFAEPESVKCVHRIRQLSEMNWRQFSDERVTEMRGHLMKYPVEVSRSGKVTSLPGHENFPDVGGKIIGSFLAIQENLTI